jgi:Rad3-related DNA helicase
MDNQQYRSKEQRQFARRVEAHLDGGGNPLLLEGSAGLGKTRAYLTPLFATRQQVAVCVPTRALATQLLESDDMGGVRANQTVEIFTPRRHFGNLADYKLHKVACRAANLLICTHQAALIDVLSDGALLGLHQRYAVVFDEADQLPDAAALRFDCGIDAYTFSALGVTPVPGKHRRTVMAAMNALPRHQQGLDEPATVMAACRGILDALDDPVWYQTVGLDDQGTLRLTHRLPARALKRLLTHRRLTFISATLTVNGSFDDFQRSLNLHDISPWSETIEPRQHGQLDVVSEEWDKDAPEFLAKVAQHVADLEGAVLVITTSHDDAALLGAMIPEATIRQDHETTGEASARMSKLNSNILVAAGAWAGLDTPIRWRHVVMPKAPYGAPTVLDENMVSRYVDSRNMAVRRFRQGLARGLRTPESICTLHLLDGRFARAEFANALPTRFVQAYKARYGTVELRTRQAEFRKRMYEKYGGRCPISGCDEPSALEAAHLGTKGGWRTNHTDGILLRRDLHALMDAGVLQIVAGVVSIRSEHYREFNGKRVW